MAKNKKSDIDAFLNLKTLAVAGVSRKKGKFGNAVFKELKKAGYKVFPLNPNAQEIEGEKCYPDLKSLPEKVDGVVTVVHKEQTEKVVKEAAETSITNIWMQQGSKSDAAVEFCKEKNMLVVVNACIFMFIEPVKSIHKFHRFFSKLFGFYPK